MTKLNPNGLSGEVVHASEVQSRVEGFLALRLVMKAGRVMLNR